MKRKPNSAMIVWSCQ